jgi:hypothetical protein
MTTRTLLTLAAITVLVLVLALALSGPGGAPAEGEGQPLVPGLREVVNDIGAVDVVGANGQTVVRLRRDEARWRVPDKDGFEADFERVQGLLRDLATGVRADERTSNPDWYARLGVQDVGEPDANGVRIDFPDTELPSLIVGRVDSSEQGRFVRLADQPRTWLSDRDLEVPSDPIEWLERSIMDIPGTELAEVTVRHSDGDTIRLRPAGEEGRDWVVFNVPAGREAAPMWELRPLANGLANLRLEDVRRHDAVPENAVRALFVTRDGLNFVASLFEDEDGGWVHFTVSAEVTASEDEELSDEAAQISADAAAVDERLNGWQYRLPERKFDTLTQRLEDVLVEPDAEETDDGS